MVFQELAEGDIEPKTAFNTTKGFQSPKHSGCMTVDASHV